MLLVITNQMLHLVKSCWIFLFQVLFKDQPFSDPNKWPKKSWCMEKLQDLHKGPQELNMSELNKDSELSALGFYSNIFQLLEAFLHCSGFSLCWSGSNFCLSEQIRYRRFPLLPHVPFSLKKYTMTFLLSVYYGSMKPNVWHILFSNRFYCMMVILYNFLPILLFPSKNVV